MAQRILKTVARKLGERSPRIVPSGGLAHSGPPYRTPLEEALKRRIPDGRIVDPMLPPVLGAACLACELAGEPLDATGLGRLRTSPH